MGKDYQALFLERDDTQLPLNLLKTVLVRVRLEQKKSARRELVFVGSLATGSLVAFVSLFSYFASSFIQSSFYQYLLLIWSEGLGSLAFWKEISLSLAESLPIFSVVVFLFVLGILLWSMARTTRDVKVAFLSA